MTKEEQLNIINDAIKQTKSNLKPLGYNLIFWSVVIISMSLFHYFFPQIVHDYDQEKAERGIVFIDEIDKIARKSDNPSDFY